MNAGEEHRNNNELYPVSGRVFVVSAPNTEIVYCPATHEIVSRIACIERRSVEKD